MHAADRSRAGRTRLQPDSVAYDVGYYAHWQPTVRASAAAVVPHVVALVHPRTVIDVGCGGGAWAAEFLAAGVPDVVGIDGDYVDRSVLAIPSSLFVACDLTQDFAPLLGRRFDLAVCLEVAEHLPADAGDALVQRLARLADTVMFSAAIPGQGGRNHLNEQWPSYWHRRFQEAEMVPVDAIRPVFWTRSDVAVWYRQNTFLYLSTTMAKAELREQASRASLDLVHPELWNRARQTAAEVSEPPTLRQAARAFRDAMGRSVRRRLGLSASRYHAQRG